MIRYFSHSWPETLEDFPNENVFNYKGSNVLDDPGSKLCVYGRIEKSSYIDIKLNIYGIYGTPMY